MKMDGASAIAEGLFSSPVGSPSAPLTTPGSVAAVVILLAVSAAVLSIERVLAGVPDGDLPGGRNLVQRRLREWLLAPEVDGIELQADQWRVRIAELGILRLQEGDEVVVAGDALQRRAVDGGAVEVADIREKGVERREDVVVRLDEPGNDDQILEGVVDGVLAPAGEITQVPRAQDAPVAHRHVRGLGHDVILRDDLLRLVDRDRSRAAPCSMVDGVGVASCARVRAGAPSAAASVPAAAPCSTFRREKC